MLATDEVEAFGAARSALDVLPHLWRSSHALAPEGSVCLPDSQRVEDIIAVMRHAGAGDHGWYCCDTPNHGRGGEKASAVTFEAWTSNG
jgi:hypothetical protein